MTPAKVCPASRFPTTAFKLHMTCCVVPALTWFCTGSELSAVLSSTLCQPVGWAGSAADAAFKPYMTCCDVLHPTLFGTTLQSSTRCPSFKHYMTCCDAPNLTWSNTISESSTSCVASKHTVVCCDVPGLKCFKKCCVAVMEQVCTKICGCLQL